VARSPAQTTVMPELTALDHVEAGLWSQREQAGALRSLLGTPKARASATRLRARAEEVLGVTGLRGVAGTRVGELSGADQRLVMLATAYASNPKVMLVDEPTSGLSGSDAARVTDLLLVLREAGATILLVEHNLPVVREVADRVTVMDAGAIIAQGTPAQVARRKIVIDAYLGEAAAELTTSPNGSAAKANGNGRASSTKNGRKQAARTKQATRSVRRAPRKPAGRST
jgi:ABC-type branched-subunit amino acid transport system ATPase component